MKEKFTRSDIHAVLTAAGTETEKARKLTTLIIEALAAALAEGRVIELRGLGTLEPRERKKKTMRNPKTGEPVNVPARRAIFFSPGRTLKKVIRREDMCNL